MDYFGRIFRKTSDKMSWWGTDKLPGLLEREDYYTDFDTLFGRIRCNGGVYVDFLTLSCTYISRKITWRKFLLKISLIS